MRVQKNMSVWKPVKKKIIKKDKKHDENDIKNFFYKSYMTYKSYLCLSFAFGFCFAKKCRGVDEADVC